MKQLILFFIVLSTSSSTFSQKKKTEGFVMFNAGMYKPGSYKPYATLSFGPGKTKDGFGVGAGFGYYDQGKAYIPVFATVNLFGPPKKFAPMFVANVGYGAYSQVIAGVKVIGGLYLKGNAGIAFPMKNTNHKGYISAGVTMMQFNASYTSGSGTTKKATSSGMFNVGIGIRFSK